MIRATEICRFGRRIESARAPHSREWLADKLRVTVNTITNWERGLSAPGALMVRRIAEATGQQITYFYEEE